MLTIFDCAFDEVIESYFVDLKVDYKFALEHFLPRISKLDFQRNPLSKKFYERLEEDILDGCIMPPITIAIMEDVNSEMDNTEWRTFIESNIEKSFVLDGIQRLSTLKNASKVEKFNFERPLYVNVLVCKSMNKLLYRMITLNNGQKSMSARHQIEILADKIINFDSFDIQIISEKAKDKKDPTKVSLNKEDIIKAYLAFMSDSINIDNQKIIEERMDSLLTDKIMQSNLNTRETEFSDVIAFISNNMHAEEELKKWMSIPNNLIGFSASSANNFNKYNLLDPEHLKKGIELFENAFNGIDVSKIQLGKSRRRMVKYFFDKFDTLSVISEDELLDRISQEI